MGWLRQWQTSDAKNRCSADHSKIPNWISYEFFGMFLHLQDTPLSMVLHYYDKYILSTIYRTFCWTFKCYFLLTLSAEAIFSTMEVISTYSQCSEKVYMCFYDLQKAFDSIQYPVLLKRLYESGVNGKAWRLLRSWYTSPKSMVRVNGLLSSPLTLERGVLQGSILSPVLFLLIMDPHLKSLQNKGLGPSVGDLYAGGFIHADDIRTISSSRATLQELINTVCTFAANNGLTLNPTKCEVILISPSKPATTAPIATLEGEGLTPQLSAKCLGY